MDEKTERLRDIFLDVADEETVTERQDQSRGTLAARPAVDEQLRSVVESMRERYDFRTSFPTADLVTVVRAFYAGQNDTEIARELGDESRASSVARARIDLHLVTDRDRDAPFDLDALRERLDDGASITGIAADLEVAESTVRRYRHVIEVERERRVVGDRFRDEFDRILVDRDLADRLTREVQESGLDDATADAEVNTSF